MENALGEWVEVADGSAEVLVRLPEDWTGPHRARFTFTAAFGPLTHTWTQGPYTLEPGDELQVAVEVPEAAWLDDLAASYVTGLHLRAIVGGASGTLPGAVVAWPEGREAGPVVWTEDRATAEAPYGVLDAALAALAADSEMLPEERLQPPVDTVAVRGALDTAADAD